MSHPADALKRPIVVVGSPRSGTTAASRILGFHPTAVLIGEPRMTWQWGNERRSDHLRPEHATPRIRRHIREAFAARAREVGASRIVEKTPANSIRMAFVEAVLPDCLVVHTIRDPRDAVLSIVDYWRNFSSGLPALQLRQRLREFDWRKTHHYAREVLRRAAPGAFAPLAGRPTWGPRLPGLPALVEELDTVAVACLQWRACVEAACQYGRKLPGDRYFEFRVEEFTEEMLDALLRFVDLDRAPPVEAEYQRQQQKTSTGSRQSSADAETLQQILEWTEPTMRWLGYDPKT